MAKSSKIKMLYMRLDKLARWPRNPKDHDIPGITSSVARWGFVKPVLIDEGTNKLVAGHGRLDVALGMMKAGRDLPRYCDVAEDGVWLIPVIRGVTFGSEDEAAAFLLADNRLTESGGWIDEELAEFLRDIRDEYGAAGFTGTGFDPEDVEKFLAEMDAIGDDPDEDASAEDDGLTDAEERAAVLPAKAIRWRRLRAGAGRQAS